MGEGVWQEGEREEKKGEYRCEKITLYTDQRQVSFFPGEEGLLKGEQEGLRLSLERERESPGEDTLLCLRVEGKILPREDPMGFPDGFKAKGAIELSLALEDAPFVAIYQHKAWWTRPFFGEILSQVPERTQLLLRRREDFSWEVVLALYAEGVRTDLFGGEDGLLHVLYTPQGEGMKVLSGPPLLVGRGRDPFQVLSLCVERARRELGLLPLEEKDVPKILEGIGWCTWDSLGQDVSEKAILDKLEECRQKGIRFSWVLIDDGWSEVDRKALTLRGLDADRQRFPKGLARTVRILKEEYQVKQVGVWQAAKGYWYGIEEGSPAHQELAPFLTRYPDGTLTVRPEAWASFGFWSHWHQKLAGMGIDFVKVDGQGSLATMLRGSLREKNAMRSFYEGLEASVGLHFKGNIIHCMGMAPENVWSRYRACLSRSSDDYTPRHPGSIVEHTLQNAFNSLYQGELYVGDWDMFWTEHEETDFSAALRAISGGPVYVSDGLGRTDTKVLSRFLGKGGELFRCEGVARPTADCLLQNDLLEGRPLKLFNHYHDSFYIACFTWDLPRGQAEGRLKKEEIPGLKPGRYLVYDQTDKSLGLLDEDMDYRFLMEERGTRFLELVPWNGALAFLGMTDRYVSMAGVSSGVWIKDCFQIWAKCTGSLSFASRVPLKRALQGGQERPLQREGTLLEEGFSKEIILYSVSVEEGELLLELKA